CARLEFNTPDRCAHFWAEGSFECNGGLEMREDGNYSTPRIVAVFGGGHAQVTHEEAALLAHRPAALFERVYGLGNPWMAAQLGNTHRGDGWTYRGAGILNTT